MSHKKYIALMIALIVPIATIGKDPKNVPFQYNRGSDATLPAAINVLFHTFSVGNGEFEEVSTTVNATSGGDARFESPHGTHYFANYLGTQPLFSLTIKHPTDGSVLFRTFPNVARSDSNIRFYNRVNNTIGSNVAVSNPSNLIKKMSESLVINSSFGNKIEFHPITAKEALEKYGSSAFSGGPWLKLRFPYELVITVEHDEQGKPGAIFSYLVEDNGGMRSDTIIKTR